MKIVELKKVPANKIGRIDKNGVSPEPHEESTAVHLTQFGFNIEYVRPRNTFKAHSADFLIGGAVWESKSPTTSKGSTIKEDFRKAKNQSDRIIFDLRRVNKHADDVEKYVVNLFRAPGYVKRLLIIRKNGEVIDFSK